MLETLPDLPLSSIHPPPHYFQPAAAAWSLLGKDQLDSPMVKEAIDSYVKATKKACELGVYMYVYG